MYRKEEKECEELGENVNGLALCAGVGGLELGLHIALGDSYGTVCYVEREAYAAATLMARMEDEALDLAPVWDDLKTFDGGAWYGVVDIVSVGYPCQPFSVAGRRAGEQDPRHLWPDAARIIRECEPWLVFLENVPNHLRLGFRSVAEDLRRMGFKVAARVLRAEEVGASHRRERLFVLAHSQSLDRQSGSAPRAIAPGLAGSINSVANPECSKRRSLGTASDSGSQRFDARGETDGGTGITDEALDHAPDPRHTSRQRNESGALRDEARGSELDGRCDEVANFPPGPAEHERWRELLVRHPELRPAISQAEAESTLCGVVDGFPSRVDRLRAGGNAVVPLQAALAFELLAGDIGMGT